MFLFFFFHFGSTTALLTTEMLAGFFTQYLSDAEVCFSVERLNLKLLTNNPLFLTR